MVLCKHFQQGNCRFGSKCHFEHIDIKQVVKNDVEGAINGKQYPFSCYGPFKDKPSIPNFIEDQSFEELRLLYISARQKNFFDKFHQQFSIEAVEALNKMKALLQPSYEIMNILTMIYDSPVSPNGPVLNNPSVNNNPFGMNATDSSASSIFGKSTINNTQTSGNVFGGTGIFGAGATANNNAMQQAGSIFGGQNTFNTQQQSSIFGQQQQQQPQQGNTGSLFGSIAKPPIFGQQQNTPQTGNSFGLFGQGVQQTTPLLNQQQRFGQPQTTQQSTMMQSQHSAGLFGGFQGNFENQTMNAGGAFGQAQHQAQTQNLFAQNMPATQNQNTVFAQPMQQPQPSSAAPAPGFFQQVSTSQPMINIQQQPQQQLQQIHPQQQIIMPQQTQNQMPAQPLPLTTTQLDVLQSIYSRIEDLTEAEIEAFKADVFEPGKLPLSAPPLELIN